MSHDPTGSVGELPATVRALRRIEEEKRLDPAVSALRPLARALLAQPGRSDALRGMWLGHAVHPPLTDLALGLWTSATVLDLVGGRQARPGARRLVGLGLLAAAPTAITGLAEWGAVDGQRERRVGVVHAAGNAAALGLYAASYRSRRDSRHLRGTVLGLAASGVAAAAGHLGGHLIEARKVASRHPDFEDRA